MSTEMSGNGVMIGLSALAKNIKLTLEARPQPQPAEHFEEVELALSRVIHFLTVAAQPYPTAAIETWAFAWHGMRPRISVASH